MSLSEEITKIEALCAEAGISMAEFLRRAGVHPTMWSRYKAGASSPVRRTWDKIQETAAELSKDAA